MLSTYFDEIIENINPPTKVHFSTNGMALTKKRADLMLGSGVMTNISISMDAASEATYRIMRPSCDFRTVIQNMSYYGIRGHELYGNNAPGFILNMTLCNTNIKETPQFVALAVELGASGIILNHLNSDLSHKVKTCEGWTWDYKEQANFISKKQHDELILEAYLQAKANGIEIAFIGDPFLTPEIAKQHAAIKHDLNNLSWIIPEPIWTEKWLSTFHKPLQADLAPCLKPWQEIAIQPNGNIRRCCYHDEQQWKLGNICDGDFRKIWNSEEMIKYRQEFIDNSMSHICFASTPCLYRGRN